MVAGVGAIVFQFLGQAITYGTLVHFAGFSPAEAAGEHSFHNKRGLIRARIPFIKTLASAITLGTGGSGGREGPIAQIGAGFGSFLGSKLGLSDRDRRIMMAAGMGAGVGAIFRAPLAGALFAGEILYRDADLESDVIVPAAISSIVGYSVYSLSLPASHRYSPLFGDELKYSLSSPLELCPLFLSTCDGSHVGVVTNGPCTKADGETEHSYPAPLRGPFRQIFPTCLEEISLQVSLSV